MNYFQHQLAQRSREISQRTEWNLYKTLECNGETLLTRRVSWGGTEKDGALLVRAMNHRERTVEMGRNEHGEQQYGVVKYWLKGETKKNEHYNDVGY